VRQAAVQALAKGWKDEPDTLAWLKSLAQSDDDSAVRQAAVLALAKGWKDESGIFELLYDHAIDDLFEPRKDWDNNPRQIALETIIEQYSDHPQTLPLLRDRAENDPDEKVREFAIKKLKKLS
jgi:HEAT repeat protein